MQIRDPEAFIRANMVLAPAPAAPEIQLYTPHPRSGLRWLAEHADAPPYWAYAWAGGCALARRMLDHPGLVAGLRVLDLGCGGGIVGVAAAKAGARQVVALDSDAIALTAARLNGEANGLTIETQEADLEAGPPQVDIVLAGDVFYEAELAALVTRYLERCLAAGMRVLVGDPYRRNLPLERMDLIAEYDMPDVGDAVGGIRTGVFAFRGG